MKNKNTLIMRAAYAIRGRAAAALAAYVAFDPVGAQVADFHLLYDVCADVCEKCADKPGLDWEWLETYPPIIPLVANGAKGIKAYLREIRKAITFASRSGLSKDDVAELRQVVDYIKNEI